MDFLYASLMDSFEVDCDPDIVQSFARAPFSARADFFFHFCDLELVVMTTAAAGHTLGLFHLQAKRHLA